MAKGRRVEERTTKWQFFKIKFDSFSLMGLVVLLIGVMMWADAHSSDKLESWLQQTTTTVLGAYIALTQVTRQAWQGQQKNGGNDGKNNPPPVATSATLSITPNRVSASPDDSKGLDSSGKVVP